MSDGSLNSDHVNYLILRYLQESGHENAAKALYRDWHRPDEYRDPESLPFAADVNQHQLVHLIQDGLFHNKLQAAVTRQPPRFRLPAFDLPATSSRPLDDLAPPKCLPRTSQSLDGYTNGTRDAMDVDPSLEPDSRSPTMALPDHPRAGDHHIDQSIDANLESPDLNLLDVVSQSTQTEENPKVFAKTMYITPRKADDAVILDALWCPHPDFSSVLLVVGESLCRYYRLPNDKTILQSDMLHIPPHTLVSAACWHPDGRYFTCATHRSAIASDDHPYKEVARMLDCTNTQQQSHYNLSTYMLRDSAMVLVIRFSPSSRYRLVISTNGDRSLLEVWDDHKASESRDPILTEIFQGVILDAVWISDESIAVCGVRILSIVTWQPASEASGDLNITNHSILPESANEEEGLWDKIRFDARHSVLVVACLSDGRLKAVRKWNDGWVDLGTDVEYPAMLTSLAFEPIPVDVTLSDDAPRRIVATFGSGHIRIYHLSGSGLAMIGEMTMSARAPPLAIAWSPLGNRLAVASDEAVDVWDSKSQLGQGAVPLWSWQAAPDKWYRNSDNNLAGDNDDDEEAVPSLNWNSTGERLVFAQGKKMAIITLVEASSALRSSIRRAENSSQ